MTILIVDDEYFVRENLTEILMPLAQEENITIVTAEDGASGLEQALLTPPDLLISDIQMHRMNGLELAEQVQKLVPGCRTIFLSNYSDKEYLRGAIHLHAVEYLEKPADRDSFIALVRKQIDHYKKELSDSQAREENISRNIANAKNLLAQLISQILRSKNSNLESLRSQCKLYDMEIVFDSAYRCILFRTTQDTCPEFTFPHIENVHILPPDLSEKGIMMLILYSTVPDALCDSNIRSLWHSLQRFPQVTGLGVGPIAANYREVFHSWQIAQSAFNQLFFSAKKQIIFHNSQDDYSAKDLGEEAVKKVFSSLSVLKLSEQELNMFFSALQTRPLTPVSDIRNYFCVTADLILQYSEQNLLDFHKNHTNFELYQDIWAATDLEQLETVMNHWIEELMIKGVGEDRIVRMITAYIHKHYSNPELGLDSLCDFTGYSKGYVSTIFKQLTGTNINTYINKVRIDNACHLLKNTDKPLKEIVSESGFSDHSYFSKIFKSVTGQTPKKYRK